MKKVIVLFLTAGLLMSLAACGNGNEKGTEPATQLATAASTTAQKATQPDSSPAATQAQTTAALFSTKAPQKETEQPGEEQTQVTEQPQEGQQDTMKMTIDNTPVTVSWENNEAVRALKELCRRQPLTISMSMYGGFEQVGDIGSNLPQNDVQTTTSSGDIVLYSGNQMVVFYGSNSWAYTRLGHITDKTPNEITQLLSNGNITVTLSY